jgi:hypothetical protein
MQWEDDWHSCVIILKVADWSSSLRESRSATSGGDSALLILIGPVASGKAEVQHRAVIRRY